MATFDDSYQETTAITAAHRYGLHLNSEKIKEELKRPHSLIKMLVNAVAIQLAREAVNNQMKNALDSADTSLHHIHVHKAAKTYEHLNVSIEERQEADRQIDSLETEYGKLDKEFYELNQEEARILTEFQIMAANNSQEWQKQRLGDANQLMNFTEAFLAKTGVKNFTFSPQFEKDFLNYFTGKEFLIDESLPYKMGLTAKELKDSAYEHPAGKAFLSLLAKDLARVMPPEKVANKIRELAHSPELRELLATHDKAQNDLYEKHSNNMRPIMEALNSNKEARAQMLGKLQHVAQNLEVLESRYYPAPTAPVARGMSTGPAPTAGTTPFEGPTPLQPE